MTGLRDSSSNLEASRQRHLGRLLLNAHRGFTGRMMRKLSARGYENSGITQSHVNVMAHIEMNGTHITTIAERTGITKQVAGQLLRDLEAQGFVEYVADPADRRAMLIKFTAAGVAMLRDSMEVKSEIEAEYIAVLGLERYRELEETLFMLIEDEG